MAQKKETLIKIIGGIVPLAGLFFAHGALAASLYLSPANGSYTTGQMFTVGVFVSSADQALNAAQGTLTFPTSKLSVLSVSKTNSVMNLWVQDPSFSNQNGTINFGGVVVNPGFEGSGGRVVTITFQVRSAGSAAVSFSAGSVLANDGKGTNILTAMQNAAFTLTQAPAGSTSIVHTNTASHPVIDSTPEITDGNWYNLDSIVFHWSLPADVTSVSYAISNNPDYELPTTPQPVVSQVSYDLTDFADGPWYFFLSFEEEGQWTTAAVKELELDRTPPEPFLITRADLAVNDDQPVFKWVAVDKTSGVAGYQVKIGDGDWFDAQTIQQGASYVLPVQAPGTNRALTVRAYDEAGNFTGSSFLFNVSAPQAAGVHGWFSSAGDFLTAWGWLVALVFACLAMLSYLLIYQLFNWKKQMRRELQRLSSQLGHDLHAFEDELEKEDKKGMRVDLRPSHLEETRKALKKEVKQIEEDVKDEVKRLDKITDDE